VCACANVFSGTYVLAAVSHSSKSEPEGRWDLGLGMESGCWQSKGRSDQQLTNHQDSVYRHGAEKGRDRIGSDQIDTKAEQVSSNWIAKKGLRVSLEHKHKRQKSS
jgi:hypothetical protein